MFNRIVPQSSFLFLILMLSISAVPAQSDFKITAGSAGPLKVGMTVADARKAMPKYDFKRTSDGEGIALIAVEMQKNVVFTLYAGEEDPEKPVDYTTVIEQIEIWSPGYKTVDGIGPDTLISDAAKKYGAVKEIMVSEIESRQYVEFSNGPKEIGFRIDYTGIFEGDERTTKRYKKEAKILSVIINGDGSESNVGFFSSYTDLEQECKTPEGQGEEGGHVSSFCEGPENFRVHIYDTAKSMEITVESTVSRANISVVRESLSFTTKGKKLEWRYKNGVPFAVILRGNKYETEDGLIKYPAKITGEYLFVRGLPGFESIKGEVNLRTTKFANEEARKIADEGYVKVKYPTQDYLVLDTSDRNMMIVKAANAGESWVKSPMQVAMRITSEFAEMRSRKIYFEAPTGEGADSFTLTVVDDGLLDDSVRGEKYVFELIKESTGVWKVSSAKKAWRCWEGRGHQDFSAVPCV